MYKEEPPDLRITLNVPQGLLEAVCRVMPESATREKHGEEEDDDESRVSLDMTSLLVRLFKVRHSQIDGKATTDSKDTPVRHVSL
mmetsp:Transcript_12785/g.17198  ORF Transcript_12785/g.17198 Transcript_12785/m.17198 type:complete len:85 (+) Transcript_12785:1-255(+)